MPEKTEEKKAESLSDNEFIIVIGGVEMEVEHRPESDFDAKTLEQIDKIRLNGAPLRALLGTKETVKVGEIPPSKMPAYKFFIDNEEACAEIFCGKPRGWAITLTSESFEAVMDTGQEINLPLFGAWFRRTMKRNETAGPGLTELIKKMVDTGLAETMAKRTANSSSTSPGSSSAPAS